MKSLFEQVEQAAARHGDAPAFRSYDETVTHTQFHKRVRALAGALQSYGVGQGDRISILADNSIDYLAYLYAATMAGAFLHVINVRLADNEIIWAVNDAASRLLIVDANYAAKIGTIRSACPSIETTIGIGDVSTADRSTADLAALGAEPKIPDIDPSDPVVLIYTSGTTGRPKGALQTHEGSLHADQCARDAIGLTQSDRFLAVMPFFHQAGLIRPRATLLAGGETIVLGRLSPDAICDAVRTFGVTATMVASGAQLETMTRIATETPGAFADLRILISGGGLGKRRMAHLEQTCKLLDCDYMGVYGQTEATGPVTVSRGRDCFNRPNSCGHPLPGFDVQIWDESGEPAAAGTRGEVMVRSVATASYWRNDAANESLYTGDWLHTGDLGYLDDDGFLYLAGRIKELIKTGAENVYPKEVEDILADHPAIADVVVFGVPDEKWGEAVTAAVVLRGGTEIDLESVKQFCQDKIGGYKIPKRLQIVDAIPRNATGKPLKHVLRDRLRKA